MSGTQDDSCSSVFFLNKVRLKLKDEEWNLLADYSRGAAQLDHRDTFPSIELVPVLKDEDCMGYIMDGLRKKSLPLESVNK